MGCFNGVCDLTKMQIIAGDEVVVIELSQKTSRKNGWVGNDIYSVLNDIARVCRMSGFMATTNSLVSDLLNIPNTPEEVKAAARDLGISTQIHSPYIFMQAGTYDDYGGMDYTNTEGSSTNWRRADKPGRGAYAMVLKGAFDAAVDLARIDHERWKAKELAKSDDFWTKEVVEFVPPSEEAYIFYLFASFASGSNIEVFSMDKPYGAQGYSFRALRLSEQLTQIITAERDRQWAEIRAAQAEHLRDYGEVWPNEDYE